MNFKSVIMHYPVSEKSTGVRGKACGWAVLSPNLWVLGRMPQARVLRKQTPPKARAKPDPPRRAPYKAWPR